MLDDMAQYVALLLVENARLAGQLAGAQANYNDMRERVAELEYELDQERRHNDNLNRAYENLSRVRSAKHGTN